MGVQLIEHQMWLDENVMRGSRPQTAVDFAGLKYQNVGKILNLERGWFEWFHGIMNRETMMTIDAGMVAIRMELGDVLPPTDTEVDHCLRIMQGPGKTFVHCAAGVDRTGYICAAYRCRVQGWSPEAAINEMIQVGQHVWYRWWNKELARYCGG